MDPALYDIGSGLACSYDNINYYLKGIYLKKRDTGLVEFTKPDFKWISYLFSVNFKLTKTVVEITTQTGIDVESKNNGVVDRNLFGLFYKKTNGLFGECPYNAQRKFVSFSHNSFSKSTKRSTFPEHSSTARTSRRS